MAGTTIPANVKLSPELKNLLDNCKKLTVVTSVEELLAAAVKDAQADGYHYVSYDVPGKGNVVEAKICKVKNGISANYLDPYIRRRDPDCMVIGDDLPTDKTKYSEKFGGKFSDLRKETYDWLKGQELAVFFFYSGVSPEYGYPSIAICPANAGFFALGLSLLQGIIDIYSVKKDFDIRAVLYVAPTFRHTHFNGKQIVVHYRSPNYHEIFSYNLYPGPSAKKGIYGVLLNFGETEQWVTAHASSVCVTTPYGKRVVIMHEGASGGGKSEMLEHIHRENDGSILFGVNQVSLEKKKLVIPKVCSLEPNTDDMALCHPSFQKGDGKLWLTDAEAAWFIRTDHITHYGVDPDLESKTIAPKQPILFLNMDTVPGGTALIWDHIEDSPGKKCPNPRFVFPRTSNENVVMEPVPVDIRSFGLRAPCCTKEFPTYGIVGMVQLLPPAIAWLWRLVAPRGHANPSIVDTEGMTAEGVGSYWPFVTGKRVTHANLLLKQILDTPKTTYVLIPNQHIGAWKVGFAGEWIAREYMSRRAMPIKKDEIVDARCPLLGYSFKEIEFEGNVLRQTLLSVQYQKEIGEEAYDIGAKMLTEFFKKEIQAFRDEPDLHPTGKKIIETLFSDGKVADYLKIIPSESIAEASYTSKGPKIG
ncbi:MAG: DUF4914 family protein [Chitinivibrionia bacterium]|nr:DUF4914 family protein [Chitinivibrionia bacterium]